MPFHALAPGPRRRPATLTAAAWQTHSQCFVTRLGHEGCNSYSTPFSGSLSPSGRGLHDMCSVLPRSFVQSVVDLRALGGSSVLVVVPDIMACRGSRFPHDECCRSAWRLLPSG